MRRFFTHLILLLSFIFIGNISFSQPFKLLYDVNYGTQNGGPQEFIKYKGVTYFTIMDTRDQGIWKTDGTANYFLQLSGETLKQTIQFNKQ